MSRLPLNRYNPATDTTIEVTQEYFDMLEHKLMIVGRVLRCPDDTILKEICKVLNAHNR